MLSMAKEPTNLTVESAVKREARLAAGRRLISLSEYTEIAWAAAIEAEKRSERVRVAPELLAPSGPLSGSVPGERSPPLSDAHGELGRMVKADQVSVEPFGTSLPPGRISAWGNTLDGHKAVGPG